MYHAKVIIVVEKWVRSEMHTYMAASWLVVSFSYVCTCVCVCARVRWVQNIMHVWTSTYWPMKTIYPAWYVQSSPLWRKPMLSYLDVILVTINATAVFTLPLNEQSLCCHGKIFSWWTVGGTIPGLNSWIGKFVRDNYHLLGTIVFDCRVTTNGCSTMIMWIRIPDRFQYIGTGILSMVGDTKGSI